MSCPICSNKAANCDCSADAIRLHEENEKLNLQKSELEAGIMRLCTAIGPYCDVESSVRFATKTRQEWTDAVRLNRVLQSELELTEGWLSVQESVAAQDIAKRIRKAIESQQSEKPCSDAEVKERLARIEAGKCPECGEKVHIHNCAEKRVEPQHKKESCQHKEYFVDGDRDVCKACGTRLNY